MRRYNPFYFILEALKGLSRNGVMTFASVAVLFSCLIVTGSFALIVDNIDYNLEKLDALNEIVVYTETDASREEADALEEKIVALDNVASTEMKYKEDALADLKESNPDIYGDITDEENPLSHAVYVSYKDSDGVEDLDYQIRHIDGVRKVRNDLSVANIIENLKNGIMLICIWFLVVLFVVTIFIIINTIKLSVFSRRNEIGIMRYIGATGWFITLPFIFEGIIIGTVASLAGYFVVRSAYVYVVKRVVDSIQLLSFIPLSDISSWLLISFLGIGIATGVLGSSISLGKYLKK